MFICKKCGWTGDAGKRNRCKACAIAYVREWERKNPIRAKEIKAKKEKKFRIENREKYNARRRRNRSKERNQINWLNRINWLKEGTVKRIDLIEIFEKSNGKCTYCQIKVKPRFTIYDPRGFDHVIPRAKGGKHERKNIVVCCGNCNGKKSDKTI